MNDTPNNHPTNKLRRWFSNRLENRIDRIWFGGVLATNAVALLFGAKYIGVFLIAYCFIFVLCLRAQIRAAYPAQAGVEYHIGFDKIQLSRKAVVLFGFLGVYLLSALAVILAVWLPREIVNAVPVLLTAIVCNGFLLHRHRALFTGCCGGGQLAARSEKRMRAVMGRRRHGSFSSRRLLIATVLFVFAWCGLLASYVTGQFGGQQVFGLDASGIIMLLYLAGAVVFGPALVHFLFLEILVTILRGWGDKK